MVRRALLTTALAAIAGTILLAPVPAVAASFQTPVRWSDASGFGGVRPAYDQFEYDDEMSLATTIAPGDVQPRDFDPAGDTDWAKFEATANTTYMIQAADTTSGSDPAICFGDPTWILIATDDSRFGTETARVYWTCRTAGVYYIRVTDDRGIGGSYELRLENLGAVPAGIGHRCDGANRYEVARDVAFHSADDSWTGITDVIITSGLDRSAADPLAASGLSGVLDAPILLIDQSSRTRVLPGATRYVITQVRRANPSARIKFWIVGGPVSVPSWVLTRIRALAGSNAAYERVSGADRYSCAARVALRMRQIGPKAAYCFIANGETASYFFDAMCAGPMSYRDHAPILLARKNSVPGVTRSEAATYAARYAVGDTPELSTTYVVSSLAATRIGASASTYDRTRVARRVAEWGQARGSLVMTGFVAANRLPDALTGGTLAGHLGAPVLLTQSAGTTGINMDDCVMSRRPVIGRWYAIGGTASMSPGLYARLSSLTGPW